MKKLYPSATAEKINAPARRGPQTLRISHALTFNEMKHARHDFEMWRLWFISHTAKKIADLIVMNNTIVKIPDSFADLMVGEASIEMEFTIEARNE